MAGEFTPTVTQKDHCTLCGATIDRAGPRFNLHVLGERHQASMREVETKERLNHELNRCSGRGCWCRR